MKDSVPGPAERQVRAAPIRTMEFNDFGQRAIFLGIAVDIVLALEWWMRGSFDIGVVSSAYAGALTGLMYGIRGYNAAARGLATNRVTSIVGIVLTGIYVVGGEMIPT
jgi:hypothetical protein